MSETREPQVGDVLGFFSTDRFVWVDAAPIADQQSLERAIELCSERPKEFRITSRITLPVVVWPKEAP